MGLTINGHYTYGLNITDAASFNPVSIGTLGVVSQTIGTALFLGGSQDWTLTNSGTVQSTDAGTTGIGISLSTGGQLSNTAGGLVSGGYAGLRTAVAATLTNAGSIAATGTAGAAVLLGGGAVANAGGQITGGGAGVRLTALGVVTNTGTIAGTAGNGVELAGGGAVGNYFAAAAITGFHAGVSVAGAGTVVNSGTIRATATTGGGYSFTGGVITPTSGGVLLGSGGVSNAAGGLVSGYFMGVGIAAGGVVDNSGTIIASSSTTSFAVMLQGGGAVTNAASGQIAGVNYGIFAYGTAAVSVLNLGTIAGTAHAGAVLFGDGTVDNAAGALITSNDAGVVGEGAVSVTNHGTIVGTSNAGIRLAGTSASITNTAGALVRSNYVGVWETKGGQVSNAGSISGEFGVVFQANPGTMTNDATGVISGTSHGIYMLDAAGSVVNSGTISSSRTFGGAAIQVRAGGNVTNLAAGHINAQWIGVQFGASGVSAGGTLTNQGSIFASDGTNGAAVWMHGPGVILNQAGGTIAGGPYGIVSYYQTTLVNSGVVLGTQFAMKAAGTAAAHNLIVVAPGAVFTGQVVADNSAFATGTLELAAGTVSGAIAGFGSKYTGFSDVIVDAGAHWSLAGTVSAAQSVSLPGTGAGLTLASPAAMAGTIKGFDATDTLTLAGITDVTAATLGPNNLLTVAESGGGTITLQFDPGQSFGVTSFGFSVAGGGTNLTVACFASGTRLLAEHGPVPVEALRPGMRLRSAFGGSAPIEWIGHRRVDCARHPRPQDVWPVRVQAGAFGPGLPEADLVLSPDHAVYVDGALIPVRYLVNGRTIAQERVASVAYWHVELPAHDVVLAEGLPAETYLDTGNRSAFANAGGPAMLHADFARAAWEAGGCAPLVVEGPAIAAARRRLLARAEALGHARTRLAALRVMAGGRVLPARIDGARWTVALPEGVGRLRLVSRGWCPDETDPDGGDARVLGVAVAALTLDGTPIGAARFGAGWHAAEAGWRWTDGDGAILVGGARTLGFDLALTGTYWQHAVSAGAATAPRRRRQAEA